jgi:hypothetical protein
MSETYAAWWPIEDDSTTLTELKAEALDEFAAMVSDSHRVIVGPIDWGTDEGEAGLVLLAKAPVSALHNPEKCPSSRSGFPGCPPLHPQTAGGASTRQMHDPREGSRGRTNPPVDVPAPSLHTTEEAS